MATGTWQRTPGPPGPAHYIAADKSGNLYAAQGMTVFRRAAGTVAWTTLPTTGLPTGTAKCLIVNALGEPLVNMCGSGGVFLGIYRFRNGAWSRSTGISATTDFYNDGVQGLCLDANGNVMAVTAWAGDVYRSTDGGSTFSYLATPPGGTGALWAIALGPDGRLWTGGESHLGVWSSHDGVTWYNEGEGPGYKANVFAIGFAPSGSALVGRTNAATGSPLQYQLAGGAWTDCVGLPLWSQANPLATGAGRVFVIVGGKFFSSPDGLHYTIEADRLSATDRVTNFCVSNSVVYALNSDMATFPPKSELLVMQAAIGV